MSTYSNYDTGLRPGIGYGKDTFHNNLFIISQIASFAGVVLLAVWTFGFSKVTKEVDNGTRVETTNEALGIGGLASAIIGTLFSVGTVVYSHKKSNEDLGGGKEETGHLFFLNFQHILTYSALLTMTIVFGTFMLAGTDNIPVSYRRDILIFTLLTLVVMIISFFWMGSKKPKNLEEIKLKGLKTIQHIFPGLVIFAGVILSGAYLNSGNLPKDASIGMFAISLLSLLVTTWTFFSTYDSSISNFKMKTRDLLKM